MRYEDWNSYTATMRTYRLSIRDVTLARTWARLETYIPYRWNQVKGESIVRKARVAARLSPRVLALGVLRVYAAWKLRQEERSDALPAPQKVRVVAGRGLIPVPVIQNDQAPELSAERKAVGARHG
jgi:hypothetical protein